MPRFRCATAETYDSELLRAWTDFCARHRIPASPRYPSGDAESGACDGATVI
ncbi:hypothetical protein OG393_32975 (plasmid) [Streptomyces sp. NBC_01216]|uniref:hypothetical protein n=1 Tax=Streptomyces sp. NBC_01216 TaxID=2903778 RepID=UPI002E126224|nr:hypothetical protein OG393_32975 [Streptomyces sp. NBC_01216]